ncbi:MAG TPA: hypothetical protein VHN99_06130, partial [Deinococcales bacterium]|nr:hypothetical protein [Deinococcales bacterium]
MASATSERVFQALLLRKRGHSLAEIARLIKPRNRTCETLTERTAAVVLHSGERTLTSCCLRDFKPDNLPEELWPPDEVR